jgi:hypothetical protein
MPDDRLGKIEEALGGPDGLNVRVARMEAALDTHRITSQQQHEQILAALSSRVVPTPLVDPAKVDPKTIAAVVVAVILGLATAFGAGHQLPAAPAITTQTADKP